METRWAYTTSENFTSLIEESKGVCVIPMGCLEKHGTHLPVGTDIIQARRMAYLASQIETCCVFPDFTFGNQGSPSNPPQGTVALSAELISRLLIELCENISRCGFKKILICNGHGGNLAFLDYTIAHRQDRKKADYAVCVFSTPATTAPVAMAKLLKEKGSGSIPELTPEDEEYILNFYDNNLINGHGGIGETAFIMGTAPESVRLDRLGVESGIPLNRSEKYGKAGLRSYGQWGMDVPNWYEGHDPVGVNERIGKAAIRLESERLAAAIKVLKEDDYWLDFQLNR